MNISVVIVSWNTKRMLKDCIKSVYAETKKYSFEIIVVDNNSPDGSADMVKNEFPDVILIANKDNKGFAAGNNQALNICRGDYILLLNPDTVVLDGAIDKMTDYIIESGAGAVTCKLLNSDGSLQKSVNKFYSFWNSLIDSRFFADLFRNMKSSNTYFFSAWAHDTLCEIDWANGAVILFPRIVMDKIGYLDEQYFIYGEEIDYYFRIKNAGYKAYFLPFVEITHHGKASSNQKRAVMFIQNYKSLYLFLKKNYGNTSYYLYRSRVTVFLSVWIIMHSLSLFIKKITGKNYEDRKIQLDVYFQTFKWHFSKESILTRV